MLQWFTDWSQIAINFIALPTAVASVALLLRNLLANRSKQRRLNEFNPYLDVLPNFEEVFKRLCVLMDDYLDDSAEIHLDNIGLDQELTIPWFLDYFKKKYETHKGMIINYRGLVIDPDAELIKPLIRGGSSDVLPQDDSNISAASVFNAWTNLGRFKSDFHQNHDVNAQLTEYKVPLIIHGVLLNRAHLFLGFTELRKVGSSDKHKIFGANKPYIYMKYDAKNSVATQHYFTFFREWFEYYYANGRKERSAN